MNKLLLTSLALVLAAASSARADIPWHDGDAPPSVAGVKLGESKADLVKQFGAPAKEEKIDADGEGLTFTQPNVTVTYTEKLGVASVYLLTPQSGDIDGVRIGTSKDDVLEKWGTPKQMQGRVSIYVVGWWAVVLRMDGSNHVKQLYVGRVT